MSSYSEIVRPIVVLDVLRLFDVDVVRASLNHQVT